MSPDDTDLGVEVVHDDGSRLVGPELRDDDAAIEGALRPAPSMRSSASSG